MLLGARFQILIASLTELFLVIVDLPMFIGLPPHVAQPCYVSMSPGSLIFHIKSTVITGTVRDIYRVGS